MKPEQSIKATKFRKKTSDEGETPLITAMRDDKIDYGKLKLLLDEFAPVIQSLVDFEVIELHRSVQFQEVRTTTEALLEGGQVFNSFLKRFYAEFDKLSK